MFICESLVTFIWLAYIRMKIHGTTLGVGFNCLFNSFWTWTGHLLCIIYIFKMWPTHYTSLDVMIWEKWKMLLILFQKYISIFRVPVVGNSKLLVFLFHSYTFSYLILLSQYNLCASVDVMPVEGGISELLKIENTQFLLLGL